MMRMTIRLCALAAIPAIASCSEATAPSGHENASTESDAARTLDPANMQYDIDGQVIRLENGVHETPAAPGSAEVYRHEFAVFASGEPAQVSGDFDGDGDEDMAIVLRQTGAGTGTFTYGGIIEAGNDQPARLQFIGDRIKIVRIEPGASQVTIHFLDRLPDEPMAKPPTQDKSMTVSMRE